MNLDPSPQINPNSSLRPGQGHSGESGELCSGTGIESLAPAGLPSGPSPTPRLRVAQGLGGTGGPWSCPLASPTLTQQGAGCGVRAVLSQGTQGGQTLWGSSCRRGLGRARICKWMLHVAGKTIKVKQSTPIYPFITLFPSLIHMIVSQSILSFSFIAYMIIKNYICI